MATVKTGRYWQHGDVLLREIAALPEGVRPSTERVLARGEATGHAHRVDADAEVEVYEREGTLYLRVGSAGAALLHEEHGVGILPGGVLLEVDRVREYDHFKEEARRVTD